MQSKQAFYQVLNENKNNIGFNILDKSKSESWNRHGQ
jgi:hypothetical protein